MDRKLPHPPLGADKDLAREIAAALRREYGDLPATVKRIAQLANARERTVKNWLAGNNGPCGDKLVALMCHSDQVLEVVLKLSGRADLLRAAKTEDTLAKVQASLLNVAGLLGERSSG